MKILFICSRIPYPLRDGGAIATNQMLSSIAHEGHEVSVVSLNTNKHFVEESVIQKEFSYCKEIKTFTINTDVKAAKALANLFSSKSYNLDRFWDEQFQELINTTIEENSFDIIQFEGLFVAQYAAGIKNYRGLLSLRQHNVEHQIWERLAQNEKMILKSWYLKLLAKRMKKFELDCLSCFDTIIPISKIDEYYFKTYYNDPILTIPMGINIKREDPVSNLNLYHIGSMEWLPNKEGVLWFLENVWDEVLSSLPEAKLFLAGKGVKDSFKNYKNVVLFNEVESIDKFTKDKTLLIVPLLSGGGIRIKIIEAMANGKLVVSTAQGVQGLIEGYKIPVSNEIEGFAKNIINLLKSDTRIQKVIEPNYSYIDANFNPKELTAQLLNHYQLLRKV